MFTAPKLTSAGEALYYKNLAGQQIKFTTIQMGSGSLTGSLKALTALVSPVVTLAAAVTNNSGQYADISGKFSNAELAEGFYWREIGVFAADPDYPDDRGRDILYCYQNAYDAADLIPVASVETVEKNISIPIIVGDAENITCTLSKSLIYASMKDLEDHDADKNAHKALLDKINETLEGKQDRVTVTGMLKGAADDEGNLAVMKATPGTDYQQPTQELAASAAMTLEDTIPFFSNTAGANKKVTLKVLKDALGVQSASIAVTTCAGAEVVCTDGTTTLNGVGSTNFSPPDNGLWTVTATLNGKTATAEVEVTGAMQYNVDLMILDGVAITSEPTKTTYDVGEAFDTAGLVVTATYADGTTEDVTDDCTISPTTMEAATTAVVITYRRADLTATTSIAVTVRQMSGISVATPPTKTAYYIGETFEAAGMAIQATMSDGTTKIVTGWTYTPTGALTATSTAVTISYTENGVTKTCTQAITIRTLSSIAVATAPTKTAYKYGETFDATGMAITATYTDGTTRTVTNWTYSPTAALTLTNTEVTISYTEGSVTKTCTQAITVSNTLSSIKVTTAPTKTEYFTGDAFSTAGMVVTATYADGSTKAVTGYTYSPTTMAASTTSVTISYTEGGVTKTATQAVTVISISTTLNSNSWATIRKVSDAGAGANYWSVGDTKAITINGAVGSTTFSNLSINAFILGFNHNSAREGANRIHFKIGKISNVHVALCDASYGSNVTGSGYFHMNTSNTNSGGWSSSDMRKNILGNSGTPTSPPASSLLAALPSDLCAVMKAVTKYSDNTGGGSNTASYVTSTTDYLFLLAEFEFQGARTYANSAEQNYQLQYDYYKAGNSKIHYKHSATTTAVNALCRSVDSSYSSRFCLVGTDGTASSSGANTSRGVAPGFCV
uniref:Ig-like domain protein n=1 Tax=Dulem virus 34 TaxID=3145752 RepID=A0AAU8B8V3_9CAUD